MWGFVILPVMKEAREGANGGGVDEITKNNTNGSLKPNFSNSLIIHQVKTKEITTVKEVWIPGLILA